MGAMTASLSDLASALRSVTRDEMWEWLLGKPLQIAAVIVGALIIRWLIHRAIRRVVNTTTARAEAHATERPGRAGRVLARATGLASERQRQRAATTGALLRSVTTVVIGAVSILTVMGIVGIPLAPLLASAGVGGVALGFGAQSLVKDFLSGIFMIVEDQYGVGDTIDTGEAIGTVEDVTLRVTKLRDANGVVWYIRNGEIIRIGNRSQGWSTALVDIPVAYTENLEEVIPLIRSVVKDLDNDPDWADKLLEEPNVVGVESMTGGAVTIRVIGKCAPDEHFAVQREIRERVKAVFDSSGVQGPPAFGPGPFTGGPR
jgi:small conductance mechanosensitive channel